MGGQSSTFNSIVIVLLLISVTGATCFSIFSPIISSRDVNQIEAKEYGDVETLDTQTQFLRCLELCDLMTVRRHYAGTLIDCMNDTCPSSVRQPPWKDLGYLKQTIPEDSGDDEDDTDSEFGLKRNKKWQYADPMQMCMMSKCQGLSGVDFYQCVYSKCITGDKDKDR